MGTRAPSLGVAAGIAAGHEDANNAAPAHVRMTSSNARTLSGNWFRVGCGAINGAWLTHLCNGCLRVCSQFQLRDSMG